jgi:hypothetical protein
MSKLKSSSSGWAKRQTAGRFGWQARFGAFTVSESQVERVRRYIRNQEQHHRKHSFEDEFKVLRERTMLASMKLICGVDSVASFAGSLAFYSVPQARLRLARGYILTPASAGWLRY